MNLAIKYIFFAGIATVANIFFQWLSFRVYDAEYSLYIAMAMGTIVGLVVKYILDKRYIFYYKTNGKTEDIKKFVIYSCMGIITTAIFWGTEIIFDFVWHHEISKYIGAIIGLSIGYITKYQLDKRFVFINSQ